MAEGARISPSGTAVGRYEVLRKLAAGGMAEILLARAVGSEGFEKHVVIKRMLPRLAENRRFVAMFLQEARIAAQLQHQNIGQVYDIGSVDGMHYFAMEYLHGRDVRTIANELSARRQRIPLRHALTIIAGTCSALEYAHNKRGHDGRPLGIVHRDVTPSNVIVTYDGAVKLVDFGIACASAHIDTRTKVVKGKVAYMSPEQCRGWRLDRRTDVFALGVVLYELTTMCRLFRLHASEDDYVVMGRIVNGRYLRPSQIRADFPEELENIIERALATKPQDRYPTAGAMLEDLEQFALSAGLPLSTSSLARFMGKIFERDRSGSKHKSAPKESSDETTVRGRPFAPTAPAAPAPMILPRNRNLVFAQPMPPPPRRMAQGTEPPPDSEAMVPMSSTMTVRPASARRKPRATTARAPASRRFKTAALILSMLAVAFGATLFGMSARSGDDVSIEAPAEPAAETARR